jgi:Mn2+/Fe2+ NRAMP family transporter
MGTALTRVIRRSQLSRSSLHDRSLVLQLGAAKYSNYLKWLTLALFAYVATAFVVHVPWGQALRHTFLPMFSWNQESLMAIVAVMGTTISPYLFFWQASTEVEEVEAHRDQHPLKKTPEQAKDEFERIRLDTLIGMATQYQAFIILTAAVTLHANGKTDINSAAEAAESLRPLAGQFAFLLFSLGIIGTGLLAVPVLAGSAAYGVGEAFRWPTGLERKPWQAKRFYAVIVAAMLLSLLLDFIGLDLIKGLVFSAAINVIVAVLICLSLDYEPRLRES